MTTAATWLKEFFSDGNGWCLDKIQGDKYPGELQLLLKTMLHRAIQNRPPFVLPRLDSQKQLWFYIVSEDLRQLGELRRVLTAYLGDAKTKIDPRVFASSNDPIETALLGRFPHGFSKLSIPVEVNSEKSDVYSVFGTINSALERYSQRPSIISMILRPTGRILSDFFVACGHRDGDAAFELFEELKASGNLSTRNLLSIELQALAAGSNWHRLLNHPSLPEILNGRISGAIADVLLDAVMHVSLRSESPDDYQIESLRSDLQNLSAFFSRLPDLDSGSRVEHWKVWSIGAAAFGYSRVLEAIPSEIIGQEWIEALTQWAGLESSVEAPTNQLDSVICAEPSLTNAVTLLQQSLVPNQREGLKIFQCISTYPLEILEEIQEHNTLRGVWGSLVVEFSAPASVDRWSSWLGSLINDAENKLPLHSVTENCRYWHSEQWDESLVTKQLYELADTENSSIVRDVVPVLRKWLVDNQIKMSSAFIELLVILLAADDVYSAQDLAIFSDLIDDLVEVPHSRQQYRDVLSAATERWEQVKSVKSLEHGFEIMDVLLDSVCADSQARLNYWNLLQEFCIANWTRLTDDQQLIVLRSAEDAIGSSGQFPPLRRTEESSESKQVELINKRLAIYTLTEGAARRARTVLNELYPNIDIQLNHDKSATAALINLAQTADYFIFASRSAAHQAFYPVTKRRDDILYPSGKGSSSIVRCFLDVIQD